MKKLISALVCLTLLATMTLAACAPATAEGAVKVGLVVAETLGDKGFYDSAHDGLQKLIDEGIAQGNVVECKSDASKYLSTVVEAAEQNDVVVAAGWQFWDVLTQVVPEMPDTKFVFVDNGLDGVGDNLLSVVYSENEGSFLVGYIAMKLSKTGKVGCVAGEDSETLNNFVVGYKQGALYANPDGEMLDPIYVGDYDSPDKGKESALALYSKGADVVFQIAGKTGLGVFEAAQETGNYAIGVDADQKYINPDHIICSMVKNVGLSIYDVVKAYAADGSFAGGTIMQAGMNKGYVGVGYGEDTMTQQVSPELKAEVEALAQKIISGEIKVDSTR